MSSFERKPNTVDVAVSMPPIFLERINAHLEKIGLRNRSGWIRSAIVAQMSREIEALREPAEPVY